MKRPIVNFLVITFAFAAGGLSVFFYLRHNLAIYEKQTSALARWNDSDTSLKEAELLITLQKGYLGTDENTRDAICFLVTSKVKRMSKDLIAIQQGLSDASRENDVNFINATKWFNDTAKRRFDVIVDSSQQLGCR